jgi:hypothetical protein
VLTPIRYDGSARIERGLTVERTETNLGLPLTRRFVAFDKRAPDAGPLLPDLVPTKPGGFHVESGWGAHVYLYGDRGLRHPPSCYPQETLGLTSDQPQPGVGALRCLRGDQGEYNPLLRSQAPELRTSRPGEPMYAAASVAVSTAANPKMSTLRPHGCRPGMASSWHARFGAPASMKRRWAVRSSFS